MLQLQGIKKSYTVANFEQVALNEVSISFRDNEFVAILGPSGSGKTTMLNIIGGLDQYDSGSLSIDGINTSKYSDRDWDTYRNNRIGFVFQSYNLIPHQTVLSNVELALTLSGVSREERRSRAIEALAEVGLKEHINKKPNQLSGGQMQRVAIARALINDPEILLADEPTGALDSGTSTQIMALLTEIAKDRLVIMVTHNPELADQYATRVVNLRDGVIVSDTNPFDESMVDKNPLPIKKTSMSFFTAIGLSFNNLMTKKGRTLMTAFAGSIGIIGIAAILSLANGVSNYIKTIEEDTLSVYPLSIQSQGMNMGDLLSMTGEMGSSFSAEEGEASNDEEGQSSEATQSANPAGSIEEQQMLGRMFGSIGANDLASLKKYLDGNGGNINDYVNLIQYSYNVVPQIYSLNDEDEVRQVNPDNTFSALGMGSEYSSLMSSFVPASMGNDVFKEMVNDPELVKQQYDVKAGRWPSAANEIVVVLSPNGGMADFILSAMNLIDPSEIDDIISAMANDEPIEAEERDSKVFTYDEILDVTFKLVSSADYYKYDDDFEVWTDQSGSKKFLKNLVKDGEDLVISGIVQANPDANATALTPGLYYTPALKEKIAQEAASADIVQAQLENPEVNVFTGRSFEEEENDPEREFDMGKLFSIDEDAIADAFKFDNSKLSIDTSNLDFSAMNMPKMSVDQSAMPEMDLSQLMGNMDLLGNISVDPSVVIEEVDLEAAGVKQEDVNKFANDIGSAFIQYLLNTPDAGDDMVEAFNNFLETPQGKEITEKGEESFGDVPDKLVDQITQSITRQIQAQIAANSAAMQAQLQAAMGQYMGQVMTQISKQIQTQMGSALQKEIGAMMESSMGSLASNMGSAMSINQDAFMDAFQFNMDEEELTQLMLSFMSNEQFTLDGNLAKLGYSDQAKPHSISIYPIDFESKAQVIEILDAYNERMKDEGNEDKVITFTDLVGALMTSVTDIINVISYVLAAFVSISLVVSSIMIGVITYVSVLERKKEIGILRSIGASKRDIRRVFNAETLIVGFVAGMLGIGATLLISVPANIIVADKYAVENVMLLPLQAGVILVAISMGLTFLAGILPASAASRKDPVEALRSE